MKQAVFLAVSLIGIIIGGHLAGHIFFGILTLIGFIALVEQIPILKWIVHRTSSLFDILIFGAGIIATVSLGVTITAALTVAGLGFTLVYRPYIIGKREQAKASKHNYKL